MPHTKQALKKQIQKTHTGCRRCGRTSFHIQKKVCAGCGYPSARNRHYNWGKKMIRRKNRGTGRMRYEKELPRRFKNGFREKVRPSHNAVGTGGVLGALQSLHSLRAGMRMPHAARTRAAVVDADGYDACSRSTGCLLEDTALLRPV